MEKAKSISTKGLTKDFINIFKIFNSAKYFPAGILQNYLISISAKKYIKHFSDTIRVYLCKSNGMPEENIGGITKSDSLFAPTFVNHCLLPDVNFNGHFLINNKISIP